MIDANNIIDGISIHHLKNRKDNVTLSFTLLNNNERRSMYANNIVQYSSCNQERSPGRTDELISCALQQVAYAIDTWLIQKKKTKLQPREFWNPTVESFELLHEPSS